MMGMMKPAYLGWVFVALGAALRLRQYFADSSFWLDEALLALNLVNRSYIGLTQKLVYNQGAPIGFLFIEKLFLVLFGNTDLVLRIFPLVSGLLALYLLYLIAVRYFGMTGWIALFLFAVSPPLIYYASELKQYSSDAMFALLLIYLAFRCLDKDAHLSDFIWLGATGLIATWTSDPSIFILAGIGLTLAVDKLNRKAYAPLSWTLGLGVLWVAAFGAFYLISLQSLSGDNVLQAYWRHAFMPLPPWSNPNWFVKTYQLLLSASLGFDSRYPAVICSVLALIGLFSLMLRDRRLATIILLPFILALIAAALQKYPLIDRFMLFLVPLFMWLIAEGLHWIYSFIRKFNKTAAVIVSGCIAVLALWTTACNGIQKFRVPTLTEDIKPVMQYVAQNRGADDIIYVSHDARPAFTYYAPVYGLTTGNIYANYDFSGKSALPDFYDAVDQLKGNSKVWFIFAHVLNCANCRGGPETAFIKYLNRYGRQEKSFFASGADCYLYDLNP